MKISLIIATYNWPPALSRVLESVLRQSRMPDEVIVADDGSGPETANLLEDYRGKFPVPLIHSWQEHIGFRAGRSRNLAAAKATSDYLILLDGDMVLHEHFVKDHAEFARPGTFVAGVRAKMSPEGTEDFLSANEFFPLQAWDWRLRSKRYSLRNKFLKSLFSGYRYFAKIRMAQTCNLALFREDFIHVNGFNEDFLGWGREDSELVCRLLNAGVRRRNLRFAAVAYHIHHEGAPRTYLEKNHQIYMNTVKNRLACCPNGVSNHLGGDADKVSAAT